MINETTYASHEDQVSFHEVETFVVIECPACVHALDYCNRVLPYRSAQIPGRTYVYPYVKDVEGEYVPPAPLEVRFDEVIPASKKRPGGEYSTKFDFGEESGSDRDEDESAVPLELLGPGCPQSVRKLSSDDIE